MSALAEELQKRAHESNSEAMDVKDGSMTSSGQRARLDSRSHNPITGKARHSWFQTASLCPYAILNKLLVRSEAEGLLDQ